MYLTHVVRSRGEHGTTSFSNSFSKQPRGTPFFKADLASEENNSSELALLRIRTQDNVGNRQQQADGQEEEQQRLQRYCVLLYRKVGCGRPDGAQDKANGVGVQHRHV